MTFLPSNGLYLSAKLYETHSLEVLSRPTLPRNNSLPWDSDPPNGSTSPGSEVAASSCKSKVRALTSTKEHVTLTHTGDSSCVKHVLQGALKSSKLCNYKT